MKVISLYGKYAIDKSSRAIIDDEDFIELSRFHWKAKPNGGGSQTYAVRNFRSDDGKSKTLRMHRVILGIFYDGILDIDHINRNPLDNRRCNLRLVTRSENLKNRTEQAKLNLIKAAISRRGRKSKAEKKWLCNPHICMISFGTCKRCGDYFRKRRKDQKFCSRKCCLQLRYKYKDRRKTLWNREAICDWCNRPFKRKQPNQLTCSGLCKRKRQLDRAR